MCAGVYGCAQVYLGVRGYAQVCAGVPRVVRVCMGVPWVGAGVEGSVCGCARVCVNVRRCA